MAKYLKNYLDKLVEENRQRLVTNDQEQMKNTEKAYSKNKRIASVLNYELYGPKG